MHRDKKQIVVDTNVPVTANVASKAGQIDINLLHCVEECVLRIQDIVKLGGLVIDENGEIFDEYRRNLSLRGQPGVGDVFLKWVHDHQWDNRWVERVVLTPSDNSYDEFPSDLRLNGFDPSDRKFIAVSNAHQQKPPILQATDTRWWQFSEVLNEYGIVVEFLCEGYARRRTNR